MDKKTQHERHQEDVAFNHGMGWIGGALVLELLLILVNKYYFNYSTSAESIDRAIFVENIIYGARLVSALALVASIVWIVSTLKKGGAFSHIMELAVSSSAAVLFCAHVLVTFRQIGGQMLTLLVPAVGGLALLFFLFQRDFFFSAMTAGISGVAVWMIWQGNSTNMITVYGFLIVTLVVLTGSALLYKQARANKGNVTVCGRKIALLPSDAVYQALFLSLLISALTIVAALLLSGTIGLYLIFALAGWLFCLLVYYTVRML